MALGQYFLPLPHQPWSFWVAESKLKLLQLTGVILLLSWKETVGLFGAHIEPQLLVSVLSHSSHQQITSHCYNQL